MSNDNIGRRAVSGMIWKLGEKGGLYMAQFVIQIVLARMLLPEEYGVVGLLSIFITLSDVFIQQGFTTALIQKKDADQVDFSSVFFANIVMAATLYALMFVGAPWVADFFHKEQLVSLMRVLSLNVIFGAIGAVHNAELSRMLDFKKSFVRSLMNVATQGIVGITAAKMGMGAWALVFSKLSGTLVGSLTLCITVKWKPTFQFSLQRVKSLFNYSSKVLVTNLQATAFNNLHALVIGSRYTSADLGYYQRGQQMPQAAMSIIDGSFSEVLYPTLSAIQDDPERLKQALRRSLKTSMFIVLPMLMGVLAVAEPLVLVLLTDVWLPCVPFMQLQCIICVFYPLDSCNHALNAIGKSNVTLRISVISSVVTIALIVACLNYGIYAIMLGNIAACAVDFILISVNTKKYLNYSPLEILKDILPSLALALVMMAIVLLVGTLSINVYLKLLVQILVGVSVYAGGAYLFRMDSFDYLLAIIRRFLPGR